MSAPRRGWVGAGPDPGRVYLGEGVGPADHAAGEELVVELPGPGERYLFLGEYVPIVGTMPDGHWKPAYLFFPPLMWGAMGDTVVGVMVDEFVVECLRAGTLEACALHPGLDIYARGGAEWYRALGVFIRAWQAATALGREAP